MGITESKKAQAVSALRQCAIEHEKDVTYTLNIRVSDLCNDIADYVEELQKENSELKWQLNEVIEDNDYYQKENEELKAKLKGFENGDVAWQGDMDRTIKQNLELKAKIETMKKDFSNALDSAYSNQALYELWKKWELSE